MIEHQLKRSIRIPEGHHLVHVDTEPDPERATTYDTENFQLVDGEGNLVARFNAWAMEDSFFGYFEYDADGELIDRKTVGFFSEAQ